MGNVCSEIGGCVAGPSREAVFNIVRVLGDVGVEKPRNNYNLVL
jgi:hypothetical protein